MSVFHFLGWLFAAFCFVAYVVMLFHIVVDVFRNPKLGGFGKAVWLIALLVIPIITALAYVVAYGSDMSRRVQVAAAQDQAESAAYARHMAGRSSTEQIANAKQLLDSGAITQDEFSRLKAAALESNPARMH
jgi:hypothetical protein